ncbi:hypothetical protein PN398_08000 [Romboutsia sp. 1001216sp1]|uniref:rolling circle replication-associated protein n=1 Tax=unclassified Romboutsia TaxID=2626894 RepID=UPI00189DB4C7|nr:MULTISPECIES: hypothetical protein [unclassified Romboutsia]MDB8790661.1 hypothetical protein [Romboutsia sp. 1001216sp1]MDB8803280.1 hypothetical protein [Romboutsia sp. 1001216sp1]MDB8814612.1 hypothetical protein [Romboutsia sp. 1001216sp1]
MARRNRNRYIEIDNELLQRKINEGDLPLVEIEKLIDITTNSIYETKTVTSGPIREVEVYPVFLKKDIPEELRLKRTKEAQKNLNNKNAVKYFIRKVNANFTYRDYYITLAYSNKNIPRNHEEAKKHIRNYIRRLNYMYKKQQMKNGVSEKKCKKIKYMFVTEISKEGKGRYHHHIIMNSVLPMEVVEETWKYGRRNNIRRLSPDENHLSGLAGYLTKDPKGKKRWGCSRNLKEPLITRSISKFSKKKINNMSKYHDLIESEMEKVNPGYKFIDAKVHINTYNGKPYIYARMRRLV